MTIEQTNQNISAAQPNERIAFECIAQLAQYDELLARRDRALAAMNIVDGLSQAEIARRIAAFVDTLPHADAARRLGTSESTVRLAVKLHGPAIRAQMKQAG